MRGGPAVLARHGSPHLGQPAGEEAESPEVQACLRVSANQLPQEPVTPGVMREGALKVFVPAPKSLTLLAKHPLNLLALD